MPGSIMPPYPWLAEEVLNTTNTAAKIQAMQTLGVPYPDGFANIANDDLRAQAEKITSNLHDQGVPDAVSTTKIIALIAYLQRLGTDIERK